MVFCGYVIVWRLPRPILEARICHKSHDHVDARPVSNDDRHSLALTHM